MRILLTNDDGIHARGLEVLREIAETLSDDVWTVAPETDQSGLAHSLTLSHPLRARKAGEKSFEVPILDDGVIEGSETFEITLSGPTGGADLGTPASAVVTLADNDVEPSECVTDATTLCLGDGRFQIRIDWRDFEDRTGSGQVVAGGAADDSGLFWFFAPANWEVLVKTVDGCGFNGHHLFFAAATTNVEYTLTVTDTERGQVKRYRNPLGTAAPAITDIEAFATCP